MSAEEKILQGILDDAKQQADKVLTEGAARCEEIAAESAEKAKAYAAQTVSDALRKAQAIKKNSESATELAIRDARLKKKHEEIEKTVKMAVEKIVSLPDDKYFALLCSLAKANSRDTQGELLLGAADLIRDVELFKELLKKADVKVSVSSTPATVQNGFILKYGDIQYNLSLDAVIADKKDALQDCINRILFED